MVTQRVLVRFAIKREPPYPARLETESGDVVRLRAFIDTGSDVKDHLCVHVTSRTNNLKNQNATVPLLTPKF